MQNIGAANADDAFYRYKMPKLLAKVEGRGNGIKTNIVNNVDVAKALGRSPEYTLKYFGCELGAQTNFDSKTGVSILNGAHDAKKLSELLEGFIKRYVQCYSCGNPETVVKIKKEFISLKCKACGHVSDVDMRHKLTTFILKNPPENKLSKEERRLKNVEEERLKGADKPGEKSSKKDKTDKKDKKDKKEKKKKGEEGEGGEEEGGIEAEPSAATVENDTESSSEGADDGVVWMTDTSAEAVRKRAEEQLTLATAAMVTQGNIEAERLEAERKAAEQAALEEAERVAAEEAAAKAAKAKADEDARVAAERAAAEAAAGDANVRALRSALGSRGSGDVAAVAAQLKSLTVEGGLAGKMRVLQEAVFGAPGAGDEKLASLLKANKALFAAHARDPAGQLAQLVALEHYLAVAAPERSKETALVIKAMYDLDLADEDVIVGWAGKVDAGKLLGVPAEGARAVRKAAAPLVEWLQQDESEEEEDE